MKGNVSVGENEVLKDTLDVALSENKDAKIVEVGTNKAGTSKIIANELKEKGTGFFWGIDIRKEAGRFWNKQHIPISVGRFIHGISWMEAKQFKDRSIDWCFIDADHSYESVCNDIDAWLPKIKKYGFFLFHDAGLIRNLSWAVKGKLLGRLGVLRALLEKSDMLRENGFLPYFIYDKKEKNGRGLVVFQRKDYCKLSDKMLLTEPEVDL